MAHEAKLRGPVRSTFTALVMWWAVGHCHGEELGLFCWPMPESGIAVFSASLKLLNILLRCNGCTRIRRASDHQTVTVTFFSCKFGFGKYFGASSQFNHWASCHIKSTFRHMSQSEKWFVLLHTIREDNTSKMTFFLFCFLVSSWGTHLSSFFIFPKYFKCWMTLNGRCWVLGQLLVS